MGRKTAVHDANADLVRELRVPSDADDNAIQEALMKLFNAQVRDQSETVSVEGQAIRAKRSGSDSDQALKAQSSDQALKASVSDQISSVQSSSVQPESESKTSRSVQFKTSVSVSSSSSPSSSQCTIAVSRSSVDIDNSLREKIYSLLSREMLYRDIIEEIESTGIEMKSVTGTREIQKTEKSC